jgi:antitoxin PrlF
VITLQEEVKVTRKYQVTIPESVRTELGVKIGDKLTVKSENKRIIMESPNHIPNPSNALWNLFGKPMDIDAVKLVEESWKTNTIEPKTHTPKQRKKKLELLR